MSIRKIVFVILISLTSGGSLLYAQFDTQVSQYMFNFASFNPAAAGESGLMDVTGQHRLHWIDMPHGGTTTFFNLNSPFSVGKLKQGIGINFMNDEVGLFVNQSVALQYALKFRLGKGLLGLGLQGGVLSVGFKGDSARGPEVSLGTYHDISSDELIPKSMSEGFGLDVTLGTWYSYKKLFIGASYTHLNQPVISWNDEMEYRPSGTLYLTGGYEKTMDNPKFVFKPSLLFRTDFVNWQADISGLIAYNKEYWGGISYRVGDAVVLMGGLNIQGGISIGYSFDIATNQLVTQNWGSHEVVISYQFEIDKDGLSRRKKFKSIRIL